jgi:hypothetical protein
VVLLKARVLYTPANEIDKPHALIVASAREYKEVTTFLQEKGMSEKVMGRIAVNEEKEGALLGMDKLASSVTTLGAEEIIFCAGSLSYKETIEQVQRIGGRLKVRFYAGNSIIGSDDKTRKGEIVAGEEAFNLSKAANRRMKRLIDIVFSLSGLLTFFLSFFLLKRPLSFFSNALAVLTGKKTWIGYSFPSAKLPVLRKGVLGPNGLPVARNPALPAEVLQSIDYWYANDYQPIQDIKIIVKNYRYLGG